MQLQERIDAAVAAIRAVTSFEPEIGLILGSGLGDYADVLENPIVIPYASLPEFPVSSVPGHKSRFVLGTRFGRKVIAMQGRFHTYEGYTQQEISIPFSQFASMVKRVARVVSKDESRAILTGVLITVEGSNLKMVATDSYRLAITETELPDAGEDFQAVIAGSFLQEIASLPRTDDPVKLALAENQIVVTYHETVFINRRIEGNFPNYRQLLPDSYATRVGMEVDRLVAGVKRTSLLGQSSSPVKFDINVASQTVLLSAMTQDVGSAQETLPCAGDGEDVEIAFNYAYVLDGLASVETEKVYLEVQSSLKPGIFRAEEGENFLYLVMPVRIS